jgi:iron(III) transport system substrate-binding protein
MTDALVSAFTRQTGIRVEVKSNDGIVLADQLITEGWASPADVYLTENSPELMALQARGLLARLPQRTLAAIPASDRSPNGQWVGMALRVSSLVYDPKAVSPSTLPKSVLELAQPQWRGKVAFAPTDSDFPPLVSAVIATFGQRAATQWLTGLKANAQVYQDEEAVTAAVDRGDVATGIANQYYWYRLQLQVGSRALRSALYYFPNHDPGSIQNVAGAAVLAHSPHQATANAFVDFLVSPTGQRIVAQSDDFEYPARPGVPPNAALPPLASINPTTLRPAALGTDQAATDLIRQAGLV